MNSCQEKNTIIDINNTSINTKNDNNIIYLEKFNKNNYTYSILTQYAIFIYFLYKILLLFRTYALNLNICNEISENKTYYILLILEYFNYLFLLLFINNITWCFTFSFYFSLIIFSLIIFTSFFL